MSESSFTLDQVLCIFAGEAACPDFQRDVCLDDGGQDFIKLVDLFVHGLWEDAYIVHID